MKIAKIGAGYVGLVSGACFSEFGHHVTCIDQDELKIGRLRRNEIPIYEPGLDALVARNAAAGRLKFEKDLSAAVADAELVFIAVGTPRRKDVAGARRARDFRANDISRRRPTWRGASRRADRDGAARLLPGRARGARGNRADGRVPDSPHA